MKFADEKRLTELRKCLGDTVKTVWENKEPVQIKSHGKSIAAIVPMEFLDIVNEHKRQRAGEAIGSYLASDNVIDTSSSFDDIDGHENTQLSPDIKQDLQHMKEDEIEVLAQDLVNWKAKCAELQDQINKLSSQQHETVGKERGKVSAQRVTRRMRESVNQTGSGRPRFVARHEKKVVNVAGIDYEIELVPITAFRNNR